VLRDPSCLPPAFTMLTGRFESLETLEKTRRRRDRRSRVGAGLALALAANGGGSPSAGRPDSSSARGARPDPEPQHQPFSPAREASAPGGDCWEAPISTPVAPMELGLVRRAVGRRHGAGGGIRAAAGRSNGLRRPSFCRRQAILQLAADTDLQSGIWAESRAQADALQSRDQKRASRPADSATPNFTGR